MDELTGLLLRAQAGDERSFAEVVHAMHPSIRRFCAHLVGSDDADDATQETFVAAWRSLGSFRGDASARTWIFVIARRSAERVAWRRRRWEEVAGRAPRPVSASSPESAVVLDDMLSALPLERRTAIVLTQIIGLTYAEAAEVCECPVGTIRSRVARAREELVDQRTSARREGDSSP